MNAGSKIYVEICDSPLDIGEAEEFVIAPESGANTIFVGRVRSITRRTDTTTGGSSLVASAGEETLHTDHLEYQCHKPLAIAELQRIADQACKKFRLTRCWLTHRVGRLEICDASIVVAVSSPHRKPSIEAAGWIMDRIKETVPIWKKRMRSSRPWPMGSP